MWLPKYGFCILHASLFDNLIIGVYWYELVYHKTCLVLISKFKKVISELGTVHSNDDFRLLGKLS
jgi:hypothetical protein